MPSAARNNWPPILISGPFSKAIAELRSRILFTLGALIVARLGTYIPMPGIDASELAHQLTQPGRRPA